MSKKPKILFVVDTPDWAIARNVDAIERRLSHKYDIEKARIWDEKSAHDKGYDFLYNVEIPKYDLVILRLLLHFRRCKFDHIITGDRNKLAITIASHHGWGRSAEQFRCRIPFFKHIFCVSDDIYGDSRKHISQRGHRFYYTPQGVETNVFKNTRTGRTGEKLTVGWAGNCAHGWESDHKRFYGVVVPLIKRNADKYNFIIAARNIKPEIAAEVMNCGAVLHSVPFDKMSEFYNSIDVLLNASKSEAIASTTVESISCGTPVITTPVGHARNIIINGKTGFIVNQSSKNRNIGTEMDAALEKLDGMNMKKIQQANRFIAKNILNWDILISHTDLAIEEALRNNG